MTDRKTTGIRQFVAAGLAVFALLLVVAKCTGCVKRGTIDDNARRAVNAMTVEEYRKALDECHAEGVDAGSQAVYFRCADEADKHGGGK